jgi:hypothetical protein
MFTFTSSLSPHFLFGSLKYTDRNITNNTVRDGKNTVVYVEIPLYMLSRKYAPNTIDI